MSEVPLFPKDVMALLGIRHPNTLRTMIKQRRMPTQMPTYSRVIRCKSGSNGLECVRIIRR